MKRFLVISALVLAFFAASAQQPLQKTATLKVAILAPMYLDSTFSADWNKGSIPRYMLPGLEFVQGAAIALDTLQTGGYKIEAHIIDSKASVRDVPWMIRYGGLDKMNMIIASVKEPEFRQLATFASDKKIPFISVTYPNDGGIRNNPYLAIVNSTLNSHLEGIYSYLVQKHSMSQIILLKKRNDDRIEKIIRKINTETSVPLLKIRTIAVDSIDAVQLGMLIDTTKQSVIIGATLNREFALEIADACFALQKSNPLVLMGMPNWDGFRELYDGNRFKDFPILFTAPHTDGEKNEYRSYLDNTYFTKYRAKPSDIADKGFEATYYFVNILKQFPDSVMQHLNEDQFACFHTFNFQPVYLSGRDNPDYFENKKVSIVQIFNGEIMKKW